MEEKSCLNCEHFAWWDGDYCCIDKMKILCNAPKGEFTDDILMSLKINKDCKKHKPQDREDIVSLHQEAFDEFMKKKKEK